MKILLIEDEKPLAEVMIDFLKSQQHVVEWVMDLPDAEEKIGVYAYDCVLIDLMLPSGSGLLAVKLLKKQCF